MIDVMLSSTVKDLLPDREAAVAALATIPIVRVVGARPVRQPPIARSPYVATVEMAEACHLYVLLLGGRYGHAPRDGKSATELEFDAAVRTDPTKVLVLQKVVARTGRLQRDFIDRVGGYFHGFWISTYRDLGELGDLLLAGFDAWIRERAAIGHKLGYFDHFLRLAIQRSPAPGVQPSYAVRDDDIELHYRLFGRDREVHIAKAEIVRDFWGSIATLDRYFEEWRRGEGGPRP
jgi:hypothetical protein